MGSDLYMMRGEMAQAEAAKLREQVKSLTSGMSGVLVTLRDGAQQFMAGADEIMNNTGWLTVLRSGVIVGIFNSGQWMHAQRIDNFPGSLVQDPSTSIWVIRTPEVNSGVPDSPLPEQ